MKKKSNKDVVSILLKMTDWLIPDATKYNDEPSHWPGPANPGN